MTIDSEEFRQLLWAVIWQQGNKESTDALIAHIDAQRAQLNYQPT